MMNWSGFANSARGELREIAARTDEVVSLRGAGSTFAAPLYKKWIDEYSASHRNVTISYDAVGSSEGVERFLAESVDFAGSDEILSDSEIAKVPGAIMLPVTAGMIVLAYNIPGVNSEIKLPRDVYVDIFAGRIRKWDDPRIQAANPGIEGVAARIRLSEGSIGYVEYWFAQRFGLRMAALQNKSGAFITPTANSGELALSGGVAQVKELAASVADPAGPRAYPITTYSWMLLYPQYRDHAKGVALREFALWGLSQPGQNYGAQLGYLPLSDDVLLIGKQALGAHMQ